jgi:hypothetical protein
MSSSTVSPQKPSKIVSNMGSKFLSTILFQEKSNKIEVYSGAEGMEIGGCMGFLAYFNI